MADGKPLIYNIKDKKWVEQYLPTSPTIIPGVGPNPSNPVSPTSPPSSGPNGAVIGGGVAGGAVILGLLMFFFYRRRKHVNVKNGSESSETPLDASSSARGAAASAQSDIESSPYPPNQPWSSASPPPPPALRPRPVSHQQQQHEYISMEPIIQAEPIASPTIPIIGTPSSAILKGKLCNLTTPALTAKNLLHMAIMISTTRATIAILRFGGPATLKSTRRNKQRNPTILNTNPTARPRSATTLWNTRNGSTIHRVTEQMLQSFVATVVVVIVV